MKLSQHLSLSVALLLAASSVQAADDMPSREDMWKIIQQQQKQIDTLMKSQQTTSEKVEETATKVEATAEALDEQTTTTASTSKTHIGGYGEMHYNNLEDQSTGEKEKLLDFHRFVLYFGHEFNERTRFVSELELEHAIAGDGQPGEIELEQAYVEHDLSNNLAGKAGLMLFPVGILNETHEPTTFYGVERNQIEKNIIPTTWWGGGLALTGKFGSGFSWDAMASSGINSSADNGYSIRKGRQKVSKATFNNGALTGRLKWTGMPGIELAASAQYQDDITQGEDPLAGAATLFETHAVIQKGGLGLRALYAQWNVDGEGPETIGADKQDGWYIEPSWRFNPSIGIFARYEQWDNAAGNATDSEYAQTSLGANYWLNEHVVFKADWQDQDAPEGKKELDGFNLGFGYQF